MLRLRVRERAPRNAANWMTVRSHRRFSMRQTRALRPRCSMIRSTQRTRQRASMTISRGGSRRQPRLPRPRSKNEPKSESSHQLPAGGCWQAHILWSNSSPGTAVKSWRASWPCCRASCCMESSTAAWTAWRSSVRHSCSTRTASCSDAGTKRRSRPSTSRSSRPARRPRTAALARQLSSWQPLRIA